MESRWPGRSGENRGRLTLALNVGGIKKRKQRCMSFGSKISSREDSLTLAKRTTRVSVQTSKLLISPGDTAAGGPMSSPAANSSRILS